MTATSTAMVANPLTRARNAWSTTMAFLALPWVCRLRRVRCGQETGAPVAAPRGGFLRALSTDRGTHRKERYAVPVERRCSAARARVRAGVLLRASRDVRLQPARRQRRGRGGLARILRGKPEADQKKR